MKRLLLTIGFWILATMIFAQNIQITGNVIDHMGVPLPGVAVMETGTSNGTVTNQDGVYRIEAASNSTLTFSFTDYTTKEVAVGGRTKPN